VWASEGARADTLAQILQSTGAELYTGDSGLLCIRLIDDDRPAEVSFAARHVVSASWRSGPESVERPNRLRLKYYSPERRYELGEIDLSAQDWSYVLDEVDRVGEQLLDIELPFCPSASQAQRIARRLFATARADRGSVVFNMAGMAAWGTKVIDVEFEDLATTFRCIISPPRCRDAEGTVEVPFIVQPALEVWDPATMEAEPPAVVPEMVYAGASDTPATPTATCVVTYPDTSTETRVAIPAPSGGSFGATIAAHEGAARSVNPLPAAWLQMTGYTGTGAHTFYRAGSSLLGIPSEFRQRGSNADSENTAWSASLLATPAAINTAPAVAAIIYDSGGGFIRVTAPTTLHVAYVRVAPPVGLPTNYPVRPGEQIQFTSPDSGLWSVTAHASNGTASASASVNV
jgi:hypothetical protein